MINNILLVGTYEIYNLKLCLAKLKYLPTGQLNFELVYRCKFLQSDFEHSLNRVRILQVARVFQEVLLNTPESINEITEFAPLQSLSNPTRLTWTEYQCTINLLDNDSFIIFENSAKPEEENAFGTGAEHETWNDVDPICWSAGRRDVVLERWKRTRWFLFTSICEKLDDPPSDATHHQTDRSQSETDEEL